MFALYSATTFRFQTKNRFVFDLKNKRQGFSFYIIPERENVIFVFVERAPADSNLIRSLLNGLGPPSCPEDVLPPPLSEVLPELPSLSPQNISFFSGILLLPFPAAVCIRNTLSTLQGYYHIWPKLATVFLPAQRERISRPRHSFHSRQIFLPYTNAGVQKFFCTPASCLSFILFFRLIVLLLLRILLPQ